MFISKGERLISDIFEVSHLLNLKGLLLTVDIEKAFDPVNHNFLSKALETYGFSQNFLKWIGILLQNRELCVKNGGKTTRYFPLKRGKRQGNPILVYLFILVLEIFFILLKKAKMFKTSKFLIISIYTLYTLMTILFFLSNENSVTEVIQIFEHFSIISGLKPNKSKCEIAGIGVLKGVQMALCSMACVNLKNKTIKILGIHFSYNKSLENDKNHRRYIIKIEKLLKLWRMRQLTIKGKTLIFKTLGIPRVVHLVLVKNVPSNTIAQLEKIQKQFIWKKGNPKLKHTTFFNKYEQGVLKTMDIFSKIASLQFAWSNRLYDDSFHA